MPANLFVLIFPRKVQAHTVFVTRRGKPKSKWGVGSNHQGGFLNRDSKHGKGNDRNSVRDPMRPGVNALTSSASSSGSGRGGGSDERSHPDGGASSAKVNELENQTTVRIQLSRPTEELEPANKRRTSWRASSSAKPEGKGFHKGIVGGTPGKKEGLGSNAHNRRIVEGLASTIPRQRMERRGSFSLVGLKGADPVIASISARVRSFTVSDGDGRSSSTDSITELTRSRGSSIESGVPSTTGASRHNDFGSTAANQSSPRQQQQQPQEGDVTSADSLLPGSAGGSGNAGGKNTSAVEASKAETSPLPQPSAGVVAERPDRRSESAGEIIEGGAGDRGWAGIEPVTKAGLANGSEGGEVEESKHPAAGESRDGAGGRGEKSHSFAYGQANMDTSTSTLGSKRRLVTEVIGDVDVDVSRPQDMDGGEKIDIEAHVKGVLWEMRSDQLLIGEPTFHESATGKLMTCIFPCDVEDAHLVLTKLESVGVGSECGSVNVLPMEIGRSDITRRRRHETNGERDEEKARRERHSRATGGRHGDGSLHTGDGERDEDEARKANVQFRALASQIRVTQVTEEIREGTKYHFDYMALLVASSAISAMGLATDNVAVVVAAMLVSPIMGPVLAFTFGTNVRDWGLAKKGFLVETLSLSVCVAVGFVVGTVGVFLIAEDTWPTYEMESRGNAWGLLTGIAIAIPSGMAVALSILSKNVNSLVGVAISASLLPPAVNTGMCLSIALVGPAVVTFHIDTMKFVMIGLISMCLTIVNILSIYVAGVCLFIFKEVAPIKSENSFWSRDMIYARKFQQKLTRGGGEGGEAAHNLRQNLLEAVNRRRDDLRNGVDSKATSPPAGYRGEPGSSDSPTSGTHHRYRSRDHRRRPTVFDLFPDGLDADPKASGAEHSGAAGKETGKADRPESLMMGLMAKFRDRKEDNANSTLPIGTEESAESTQRWLKVQNLLGGTGNGGGTLRGGGSLPSTRGGGGGNGGGGNGGGGGSLRANGGGSLRFSRSRASSKGI